MSEFAQRGILIAVEGIDGAGKTTQVRMLVNALHDTGESVTASKEPTNGQWGSILRQSATTGRLPLEQELEAFINDRQEHVDGLILPALKSGGIVILDRYFYSTIAYQGARGANVKTVWAEMVKRFPLPDVVFLLDVDPIIGIHRIANDRGEKPNHFEDRANLSQARTIFEAMHEENIHHLNGALPIDAIHDQILEFFVDGPLKAKRCAKDYGCTDSYHCMFAQSNTCEWNNLRARIPHAHALSSY